MNYLAHGYRFLDRPCFVAGTALPDWLSVADRSVRVRAESMAQLPSDLSPPVAEVLAGVAQHLRDDAWFHSSPVFEQVSRAIAMVIRSEFALPRNYRASFLAHVLTELLIDSVLIQRDPSLLDRYYAALQEVDDDVLHAALAQLLPQVPESLVRVRERFIEMEYLRDYCDDDLLIYRLGQVSTRASMALPDGFRQLLPRVRELVETVADELLPPS